MSTTPSQVEPSGSPDPGTPGAASRSPVLARPRPTPKPRIELCPYCGRESVNTTRCSTCGGQFDALSKQATQNAMGPWWLREGDRPLRPGCSYDTIKAMVGRGTITAETVLRGPTTRQFWTRARRVPGVAHLLGVCHSCQREVAPDAFMCAACGASFVTETDRQHLGLSPVALLPGQAAAERIAAVSAAALPIPMGVAPAPGSRAATGAPTPTPPPSFREVFSPAHANSSGGVASIQAPATRSHGHGHGHGAHGAASHEPIETVVRYVRRPRSMVGTLAIMFFGGMLAVGGVWVALLVAQGSSAGALLALGIDPGVQPANRLARSETPTAEPGIAESELNPSAAGTSPQATDAQGDPGAATDPQIASSATGPAAEPATTESPAPETPADSASATILATILEHVQAGGSPRLQQATALVDQAERQQLLTGDEASAWRLALQARVQREAVSGLP